jgi:VWFA-related protein
MPSRRRLVLLALAAAAAWPLAAQQAPPDPDAPPPGDAFYEAVEVTLVNVEVHVTDREGRPLVGLASGDFEVREDGRPVAVTHFAEVTGQRGGPTAPLQAPPAGAPPAAAPPPSAAESQQLHLVVYIDNLFLRPFNRNRVIAEVRSFIIDHLRPGDRGMLVTFERSLHVRQPFTGDPRALALALDGIDRQSAFGVQQRTERAAVIGRIEQARSPAEAELHADNFAKAVHDDARRSVAALKELVRSLAGLPGRKALLYVTDGLPLTAGEDLFHLIEIKFRGRGSGEMLGMRYRIARELRELSAAANANRVTFYTLEAAGLRGPDSVSAERGGSSGVAVYAEVDAVRDSNEEQPLVDLAADTGGLASLNTNNWTGAFARIAADLGSYYSLGYTPAHGGDGRYHPIEVRVKRPGARVRHRTGYRAKTSVAQVTEGALAALLHGVERNPLRIEVELEPALRQESGNFKLPLRVRVPIGALALLPQGDRHLARLRVSLAVADGEGNLSPVEVTPVPIEIPAGDLERARAQYYVYEAELMVRPGDQLIAVGVRDDLAGESSFVRRAARIAH